MIGEPAGDVSRATVLALALVVTLAARAIPSWFARGEISHDLVLLALGLCLALSAPRRSGLTLGRPRGHVRGLLLVCGGPILLTALVYPNLAERPFAGASWSLWAISPLAQDLVFIGFLYGFLDGAFPGNVHARLPVRRALVLTALFFALWHVPNFRSGMSPAYVTFQLGYTAVGLLVIGLSRQWTGSILYAWLTHTAVNAIVWVAD